MKYVLHLESAAADLVSNPSSSVNIGTKIPPPPTPPTVPNPEPRKPITVARTILQLNFNACKINQNKSTKLWAFRVNMINTHRPDFSRLANANIAAVSQRSGDDVGIALCVEVEVSGEDCGGERNEEVEQEGSRRRHRDSKLCFRYALFFSTV